MVGPRQPGARPRWWRVAPGPTAAPGYATCLRRFFTDVREVGVLANPYGVLNIESGGHVYLCTGPRQPWSQLWLRLRHYDWPATDISPVNAAARPLRCWCCAAARPAGALVMPSEGWRGGRRAGAGMGQVVVGSCRLDCRARSGMLAGLGAGWDAGRLAEHEPSEDHPPGQCLYADRPFGEPAQMGLRCR